MGSPEVNTRTSLIHHNKCMCMLESFDLVYGLKLEFIVPDPSPCLSSPRVH